MTSRVVVALLAGGLLAFSGAVPAFADEDIPQLAEESFAPPAMTWAGFYLGAHGGYAWGDTSVSDAGVEVFSLDNDGGLGGIHAGYNWQNGTWVYGLEADISGGSLSGEESCTDALGLTGTGISAVCSSDVDYLASIRARLGLSSPSHLLFVTAGVAFTDEKLTISLAGIDLSASQRLTGYVVGGGAEWKMMPNFSLRGEVLHYGFGEDDFTFTTLGTSATAQGDLDTTVLRVGASLHLN